jgi:hypothetical protein
MANRKKKSAGSRNRVAPARTSGDGLPSLQPPVRPILARRHADPVRQGVRLMAALRKWVGAHPGRRGVPYDELPETGRLIVTLDEMHKAIYSSGMLYVLDWTVGDQFHEAMAWLRKMGAKSTVAYFRAAAALFPRKQVPRNVDARTRVTARLEEEGGHLDALDDAYREVALTEIPERLRDYLAAHEAEIAHEMASATRQDRGTSPDEIIAGPDIIAQFQADRARRLVPPIAQPTELNANIGDVLEFKARKRRAYGQVSHRHAFTVERGPIVRILPGSFARPITGAQLRSHVAGKTAYFLNMMLERRISDGEATIVATLPVPAHAKPFPTFLYHKGRTRDGRHAWGLWQGGEEPIGQILGPLSGTDRQRSLLRPWLLTELLVEGWTPEQGIRDWGDDMGSSSP